MAESRRDERAEQDEQHDDADAEHEATTKAGASRFGCCSNEKRHLGRVAPSTWTERCPADALTRGSPTGCVSAIGNGI